MCKRWSEQNIGQYAVFRLRFDDAVFSYAFFSITNPGAIDLLRYPEELPILAIESYFQHFTCQPILAAAVFQSQAF
jgi:hypothetical protein